jgi:glycerol-1-phosphate dehydrogenase [NAD(P)+]
MFQMIENIRLMAAEYGDNIDDIVLPERIVLEAGAVNGVADYVRERGSESVLLVADEVTHQAVGERLLAALTAKGIRATVSLVLPNAVGDVVADEASVVQVLLDMQRHSADMTIVCGAGTLHDIARYAAYTAGIPFLSVPTAPSVDGFTSKGAPLIIRGDKITVAAVGPDAIFADLDILCAAPAKMVAAGFGDMLGKYTSLFDWSFGSMTADEPYSQLVARMTRDALDRCVAHADAIGRRTEEGIAALTSGLIESGLAMLVLGQSHPASGAEHHLSHYWEMSFIKDNRRQLLHGAKVGVSCTLIAELYERIGKEGLPGAPARTTGAWDEIRAELARIPCAEQLRELLRTVGGPSTLDELGVSRELADRSLEEAHRVRMNRYTLLRAFNKANGRE